MVCVANPPWEGDYVKSTVKLMLHLSEWSRVIYVEYACTWLDVFRSVFKKSKIPLLRVLGLAPRLFRPDVNDRCQLFVLTPPPVLPINWLRPGPLYNKLQEINSWLVVRAIKRALVTLEMDSPVVINAFQPSLGMAMKGKLNEKMTAYYCYDEISQSAWCRNHGAHDEIPFMNSVDVVITSSDALKKTKERHTAACYVVKNGVEPELFEKAHAYRASIKNPLHTPTVIGFVGCIDSRLDIDLLENLACLLDDFCFQFIGPIADKLVGRRLEALDNVELLGPCKQEELPDFMKFFSAGIIPFKLNQNTRFIYPMKVNEYLAAALPVVMTAFAELSEFRDLIYVADGASNFASNLREAIIADNDVARKARQEFARKNSWKERAVQFATIVEDRKRICNAAW